MTNTKWLSALLAGTALTVASTAAMADTSLVTMTRNAAGEGVTFSVAPTADMPASATEITVGGRVRAEVYNENYENSGHGGSFYDGTGIRADWALYVSGKTDTSVGQVRAFVNMYGYGGGSTSTANVSSVTAAGEWDFAPGLTLIGGRTTTLDGGTMGYGADIGTWLGRFGTAGTGAALAQQISKAGWEPQARSQSLASQFQFQKKHGGGGGGGMDALTQYVTTYNSSSTSIGNYTEVIQTLGDGASGTVTQSATQDSSGTQDSVSNTQDNQATNGSLSNRISKFLLTRELFPERAQDNNFARFINCASTHKS